MTSSLLLLLALGLASCRGADKPQALPMDTSSFTDGPSAVASKSSTGVPVTRQEPDRRSEGPADFRFERPVAWPAGSVTWFGSCREGFANGGGVMVNSIEGQEPERFYGQLERGYLSQGVLQTAGGYLAGNWAHGDVLMALEDGMAQRNVVIAAFQIGANAASSASKSFASKGDAKMSQFYAKQAKSLRDQMD